MSILGKVAKFALGTVTAPFRVLKTGLARAIGRAVMPTLVKTGLRISRIADSLVSKGIQYQKKTMLADIAQAIDEKKSEDIIEKLPSKMLPPVEGIAEVDLRRARNYLVKFDVDLVDPETGMMSSSIRSMYTDDFENMEDWEDEFLDDYRKSYKETEAHIVGIKVRSVMHNKGFRY